MIPFDSVLVEGNLVIRSFRGADRAALIAGRDQEFHRFMGDGSPVPTPAACICLDHMIVGWIDYDHDRPWLADGEVNVGYNIFADHRGNGYGTTALMLLSDWLQGRDPPIRPTLLIDPDNSASLALAARAGFRCGTLIGQQRLFTLPPGSGEQTGP